MYMGVILTLRPRHGVKLRVFPMYMGVIPLGLIWNWMMMSIPHVYGGDPPH